MAAYSPNFIANGTIEVSRFVKIDTTAGKKNNVIQAAAASDRTIDISQDGPYDTPDVTGAADDAARAGLPLKVFGLGEMCLLKIGTGGCTAGDELTSDASGQGVVAATTNRVGAIALET